MYLQNTIKFSQKDLLLLGGSSKSEPFFEARDQNQKQSQRLGGKS